MQFDNHQPNQGPQPPVDNTAPLYKRVAATFIDLFIVDIFASILLGIFKVDLTNIDPFKLSPDLFIKMVGSSVLAFFLINGFLLLARGQTLGKRLMNIAIVDLQGGPCTPANLILNRYISQVVMIFVPLLNIVDFMMMFFRRDRRCLHDLLAKTRVIDLGIKVATGSPETSGNSMLA